MHVLDIEKKKPSVTSYPCYLSEQGSILVFMILGHYVWNLNGTVCTFVAWW